LQQFPEATIVAGFHAWKKRNRWVMKGETGIAIFAPMVARRGDDKMADVEREPENTLTPHKADCGHVHRGMPAFELASMVAAIGDQNQFSPQRTRAALEQRLRWVAPAKLHSLPSRLVHFRI